MDEIETNRVLDLAFPEIDRHVQLMLDRLDAATGNVAVRKALHARFIGHAIAMAAARFPENQFLPGVIDAAGAMFRAPKPLVREHEAA